MSDHPVSVEITSPERFDRVQLLLRIALAILLAWVGVTAGWLVGLLFIALPVTAAIAISSEGSEAYMSDFAPRLWRVLSWLLQLAAYMSILIDRFPAGDEPVVTPQIRFTGRPTVGSALARIVTSIPSGLVLAFLWCISSMLWVIAALLVLVGAPMPHGILAFQRGVLRWQARLVAYHASLVVEYPPWSLETGATGTGYAVAGAR